jgi:glycosyltransferase involved in cell wall biosynthesis
VLGEGPERAALEDAVRELGLEGKAELVGGADQEGVARWFGLATIAALPSNSEGAPVSLMEAAACGLPAVATDVGGVAELVRDGVTGFVVPPGDVDAFTGALERLLQNPDEAARMGAAARAEAERRFSVTRQVDDLVALWERCLAAPAEVGDARADSTA